MSQKIAGVLRTSTPNEDTFLVRCSVEMFNTEGLW